MEKNKELKIGFGYDVHRMIEGRDFIIGGVKIPHNKGLLGHSDGDVVLHSICDSLLACVGAGEIGVYFPPTDLTIMGISSIAIAEKVIEILKQKKATVNQIDVTIVAEEPQIKPHYEKIKQSISKIFNIDYENVSLKAKSMEGLGEVGKGQAIICYALSSVYVRKSKKIRKTPKK